jgi:hypothetical protein
MAEGKQNQSGKVKKEPQPRRKDPKDYKAPKPGSKLVDKNGGKMNQFLPGFSGNPMGRPKKYVGTLKAYGYRSVEIADALKTLLAMNKESLQRILDNEKDYTVLEVTVAGAILRGIKDRKLDNVETIITRLYGTPKGTQEVELKPPAVIVAETTDQAAIVADLRNKLAQMDKETDPNEAD